MPVGVTSTGGRSAIQLGLAAVTVVAVLSSSSCADDGDRVMRPGSADRQAGMPAPVPTVSASDASTWLAALPRQERPVGFSGYSRAAFGPVWMDIDDNGCNQRDDVLLRDANLGSAHVQRQRACDHDVLAGRWVDPYSGAQLVFTDLKDPRQAQAIQIDHVVPLAEAWVSGASSWSDRRRLRFANDLDGLVASSGPVNASKGAFDPAAWRPKEDFQCSYASRWIQVKHRWGLAVDESESRALVEMLGTCGA